MTDTPTPGAAAELPVVGYAIRESDQFVWADTRKDRPFAKAWRAVVYADDAQSQLDALREEVERKSDAIQRLWKERDSLREEVARLNSIAPTSRAGAILGQMKSELDAARSELAAIKAQPTDVDALMALAEKWGDARIEYLCGGPRTKRDAAREALRAKLAARKEEL